MKKVNDKELAAVIALPSAKRYEYFVKSVADYEELWTLRKDNGFVLVAADDERELVPVWPHRRFAEICANENWEDAEATSISLERWLTAWTPGLTKDNRGVAVFPIPSGSGLPVPPSRLHADLTSECSKYE